MEIDNQLVTYDKKTPKRSTLVVMRAIGWLMIMASVVSFAYCLDRDTSASNNNDDPCVFTGMAFAPLSPFTAPVKDSEEWYAGGAGQQVFDLDPSCANKPAQPAPAWYTEWHAWYGLVLVFIGAFLVVRSSRSIEENYRKVRYGKVLRKHRTGGSFFENQQWKIQLEGNTWANEKRCWWSTVWTSVYDEAVVGEYMHL